MNRRDSQGSSLVAWSIQKPEVPGSNLPAADILSMAHTNIVYTIIRKAFLIIYIGYLSTNIDVW